MLEDVVGIFILLRKDKLCFTLIDSGEVPIAAYTHKRTLCSPALPVDRPLVLLQIPTLKSRLQFIPTEH
jgi:hypothetical protein